MDPDLLFLSIIFGAIGMGYFVYGKKNARLVPMIAGMALCGFPYFVSSGLVMILVGTALTLGPWFLRQDS